MKLQLNVPGISCGGCVGTITQAIKAVDAHASVQGDPKTKTILVETESSESAIKAAISEAGYPAS
jgi:copper chaperone